LLNLYSGSSSFWWLLNPAVCSTCRLFAVRSGFKSTKRLWRFNL
jgi:hypothetical protein